jgi:HEAT repeat protein
MAIFFFIAIIGCVLIFITFYLIRRSTRSKKRKRLRNYFGEIISEIAICESVPEIQSFLEASENKNLHKLLESSFSKQVFIRQLTKASANMVGTSGENLKWVYEHFRLEKDSEIRMQSNRWHIKAKAIQELAQMQQKRNIKKIYRLANHSNALVRQEAQTAIVQLFGFSGLRFLNVVSYTITDWQQFCLLHELTLKHIASFAGTEKWLRSSNTSVVIFALRLVETYHWHELHDDVTALLIHPSERVQQKAIETLGEIYQPYTGSLLTASYIKINKQLQFTVLKVLEKTATKNEVPFLLEQLKHPDNQFKLIAARAIHNCSEDNATIIRNTIINNGHSAAAILSKLFEEKIV